MMKNDLKLSDVVKLAAETAVITAIEQVEKEKRLQQKKRHDWRFRNTKLLLKNYRAFVEHSEETKLFLAQGAEVLDDLYTEELAIDSIMRSKQRTLVMVEFIKRMLESYRIMCEQSGHDEEIRRYKVIHAMYISDEICTVEEIAKCHFVDVRTVYRDINDASRTLSVLIFGVDGVRLE